jgi:hypothetical protein
VSEPRIIWPRLPLRARVRLRVERHLDRVGCTLVEHGRMRAAEWWWRAFRLL